MTPPPGGNGGDPDSSDHDADGDNRRADRQEKAPKEPNLPEGDEPQLAKLVKIMSMALGGCKRKPPDPPFISKHLDYHDVKVRLLASEDYFARNATYWMKEEDKIIYGTGRMEEREVAPFGLAYRKQMTGELAVQKEGGYEYWYIFKAQVILRFHYFPRSGKGVERNGTG